MVKNDNAEAFVAITNRAIVTCESTQEISVWVIKGLIRVGDWCFLSGHTGMIRGKIIAIRTNKGYLLETEADTQAIITFSDLPVNVHIPKKSIISAEGYSAEEYAKLPFEMIVDTPLPLGQQFVITGRIRQGVIRVGDAITITNDSGSYTAKVVGIEQFRKLLDALPYGENCGLILSGIKEDIQPEITEGSKVSLSDLSL